MLDDAPAPPPQVQFGMRSLLVLTAVAAVAVVALKELHIYGLLLGFVGFLLMLLAPVPPRHEPLRRLAVDLLAGAILPLLCIFFDPGILASPHGGGIVTGGMADVVYAGVAWEVVALVAWLLVGPRWPTASAVWSGTLIAGVALAAGVGLALLPMTLIGLIVLIGALGLVPWFTAWVYYRNARQAFDDSRRLTSRHRQRALLLAGLALALAIALALAPAIRYLRSNDAWPSPQDPFTMMGKAVVSRQSPVASSRAVRGGLGSGVAMPVASSRVQKADVGCWMLDVRRSMFDVHPSSPPLCASSANLCDLRGKSFFPPCPPCPLW